MRRGSFRLGGVMSSKWVFFIGGVFSCFFVLGDLPVNLAGGKKSAPPKMEGKSLHLLGGLHDVSDEEFRGLHKYASDSHAISSTWGNTFESPKVVSREGIPESI